MKAGISDDLCLGGWGPYAVLGYCKMMACVAISASSADHGFAFAAVFALAIFEFVCCDKMLMHTGYRRSYLITTLLDGR